MRFFSTVLCLVLLTSCVQSTVLTLTGGAAATILGVGAKKLLIKKLALLASRGKRETVNDVAQEMFLDASVKDADDCAKKIICMLNALPKTQIEADLSFFASSFGHSLDVTKSSVEFDLAAMIGKGAGYKQCQYIYQRCPQDFKTLVNQFRA